MRDVFYLFSKTQGYSPKGGASLVLGRTSIAIAPIGIGCWAWGDDHGWGGGPTVPDPADAFRSAISTTDDVLFDTAESYAKGESERLLGHFQREFRGKALLASKFSPTRWESRRKDLFEALRGSLSRLQVEQIDLYQIHWPTRFSTVASRMSAMADARDEGLIRAIGVSNSSRDETLRAYEALGKRGCGLSSVQLEYSLIHREPERNGILQICRELGITFLAYSPLAMGLLTGKYTRSLPGGYRASKYPPQLISRLQPLLGLLRELGENHGAKTPAQVALSWITHKGALPIPGAKNGAQAKENLQSTDVSLSESEMSLLDEASARALKAAPRDF